MCTLITRLIMHRSISGRKSFEQVLAVGQSGLKSAPLRRSRMDLLGNGKHAVASAAITFGGVVSATLMVLR